MPGMLIVIPTPIGNLEDITHRAVRVLGEVEALACEDTRHTGRLLAHFGIARPRVLFSCHGHNERTATKRVLSLLAEGLDVGLCSDAGLPGLSDPGQHLIEVVLDAGFEVDVLPGASAAATAFLSAGLRAFQYSFLGFLPQRRARRRRVIEPYVESDTALVIYESPRRIARLLGEAREILGDRRGAVCLELTKKFQRVERGRLSELEAIYAESEPRGEATLVIGGAETLASEDN